MCQTPLGLQGRSPNVPNPTGGSRAGLQGWSLPQHCCASAKGLQVPAPTTLLHVIVWPGLLAQPVKDPPTPIPVKNARPPRSAPARWWYGPE